jgi:hypothetical protein
VALDPVQPAIPPEEPVESIPPAEPVAPAIEPMQPASSPPAPPAGEPGPTPPPTTDPALPTTAPATRAAVARRQRIRKILQDGMRVSCRQRAGAVCTARVTVRRVVAFRGARRLTSAGRTVVRARVTRAGRRLLAGTRRHRATLTVSVRGAGRVTRHLTLVR